MPKTEDFRSSFSHLEYLDSPLEIKLHLKVVEEAIAFLFSPAGFPIISWLYKIAVTETLVAKGLVDLVSTEGAKASSRLNKLMVHRNFTTTYEGIFGFVKYNSAKFLELEKSINSLKIQTPEEDLLLYSLVGLIVLTPWKTGFELPKVKARTNISSFYVCSKIRQVGGYFLLNKDKSKLHLKKAIMPINLDIWMSKATDNLRGLKKGASSYIKRNLPAPFSHLELIINLPSISLDKPATFQLVQNDKLLAHIDFWLKIKHKRDIKRFRKKNSNVDKTALELLYSCPTALIYDSTKKKYEHILLAIINSWLINSATCD